MAVLCQEIVGRVAPIPVADLTRYDALHPLGRQLIQGWLRRATGAHDLSDPISAFEAFVFTWIATNSWGACVTDQDQDQAIVVGLAASDSLQIAFLDLMKREPSFDAAANEFASLWPIFKVADLRAKNLQYVRAPGMHRRDLVQLYLNSGADNYAPSCWKRHGGAAPADWPHTISALYRVRCNLFHGEKNPDSEIDRVIVDTGFRVLSGFISGAELF